MSDDFVYPFLNRPWCLVKNGAGEEIPAFSVVRIVSEALSNRRIVYTVAKPNAASTDFLRDYLVIGPFKIPNTSTALGFATSLAEAGFVRYDGSGTPAKDDVWGPKHGQFTLTKNYYGFTVRGGNTTVGGNNVTLARQTGVHTVLGKIDDSSVSVGSSCTVSVWAGAGGSEADTTMNITGVYNRATALTSISGKYCMVGWNGGVPYLMWVAC